MSENERGYGLGLSVSAVEKRSKQLAAWEASETNRLPSYLLPKRSKRRVKFSKEVMFLAAVSSGDQSEVERVLQEEGVDVNCRNNDGLTAIHQCCIDDDIHMLQVLVNHGGNVNSVDNEGWTPLHAATSCNFAHIVKYLLENNAFPAPVNNEGQTPLDLAEEYDDIADLLNKEINRLGIDVDDVKCEEERIMLEDAKKLRNNPKLEAMVSPGGATPLHVAAAKNYTTVIHVLLSIKGIDVDARDDDGWTPLHAAVHWESMEAAELLILSGANIYVKTDAGEELDDLVDPDLEDDLKQLKKLNSYVNPEQDQLRTRRNAINRRNSSNSNMSHSNSIDKFPSPALKRRLSKDKFPKMIDMKKEKEDLMQSFEKMDEETIDEANNTSSNTATGSVPEATSNNHTSGSIPIARTGSNSSPKNNRRKNEISQKMLDRMNMFEGGTNPGSPPAAVGSLPSAIGGSPHVTTVGSPNPSNVSSPRTSTPITSPPTNGSCERKKVDSTDMMRGRVGSMDNTSTASQTKNRFSFQPKTVSGGLKSMSLDRSSEQNYKDCMNSQRPSSLISTPRKNVESHKEPSTTVAVPTPPNTVTATPTINSSLPLPSTDVSTNSDTNTSKERSSSILSQPEARRKSNSRKIRETRRTTQPVPSDLLERINKHDIEEEQQLHHQEQSNIQTTISTTPSSITTTSTTTTTTSSTISSNSSSDTGNISKGSSSSSTLNSQPTVMVTESNTSINSKSEDVGAINTSNLSPQQIPRTKSGTRRKPKEKRRSTGIPTEVDEDCEIPDNLKGIIGHSRSGSCDSNDSSGTTNCISDVQGVDDSSVSAATIEYYTQEIDKLKKLLVEEKQKSDSLSNSYEKMRTNYEMKEKECLALQQKYEASNKALELQTMQCETDKKRIYQLEKSQKGIQELKAEIQRLKDENGALIRVVGKLSRAPINS